MSEQSVDAAVLIADDDPVFRSLVNRRVQMLGARVLEASSGTEAWQILTKERVDLALIDLDMPGMTGVELIQCIRGYPKTKHLPAVVITSISRGEMVRTALGAGCTAYLTKPLQWPMFGSYIGQLLETSRRLSHAEAELAMRRYQTETLIGSYRSEIASLLQRSAAEAGLGSASLQALSTDIARLTDLLEQRLAAIGDDRGNKSAHAA